VWIGNARSVYVNVPEQSAEKLYARVKEVTASAAETLKRIGGTLRSRSRPLARVTERRGADSSVACDVGADDDDARDCEATSFSRTQADFLHRSWLSEDQMQPC
jgi:hypothetical protein